MVHNPFVCNCHLAWFSDWLKNKGLSGSPPRCAGPDRVKDVPIRELPKTEFKCTSRSMNIKKSILLLILFNIHQVEVSVCNMIVTGRLGRKNIFK